MANVNKSAVFNVIEIRSALKRFYLSLSFFAVGTQGDSSHQEVHDQSALEQKTNGELLMQWCKL